MLRCPPSLRNGQRDVGCRVCAFGHNNANETRFVATREKKRRRGRGVSRYLGRMGFSRTRRAYRRGFRAHAWFVVSVFRCGWYLLHFTGFRTKQRRRCPVMSDTGRYTLHACIHCTFSFFLLWGFESSRVICLMSRRSLLRF